MHAQVSLALWLPPFSSAKAPPSLGHSCHLARVVAPRGLWTVISSPWRLSQAHACHAAAWEQGPPGCLRRSELPRSEMEQFKSLVLIIHGPQPSWTRSLSVTTVPCHPCEFSRFCPFWFTLTLSRGYTRQFFSMCLHVFFFANIPCQS